MTTFKRFHCSPFLTPARPQCSFLDNDPDLYNVLSGMSIAPQAPLDLASARLPPPQTPRNSVASSIAAHWPTYLTPPLNPLLISSPLHDSVPVGRSDFLHPATGGNQLKRPETPTLHHALPPLQSRFANQRRPHSRPRRSRLPVYRPELRLEADDAPPPYSALDPLLTPPSNSRNHTDNDNTHCWFGAPPPRLCTR